MNKSNSLNEHFTFLVVDDNERKLQDSRMIFEYFGVDYSMITGGQYSERVMSAVMQIHQDGKFPVIFLDENLGYEKSGTDIVRSLISGFKDIGGLILPFSSDSKTQLESWSSEVNGSESWHTPLEAKLPIEYFKFGDIDEICTNFINEFDNREHPLEKE